MPSLPRGVEGRDLPPPSTLNPSSISIVRSLCYVVGGGAWRWRAHLSSDDGRRSPEGGDPPSAHASSELCDRTKKAKPGDARLPLKASKTPRSMPDGRQAPEPPRARRCLSFVRSFSTVSPDPYDRHGKFDSLGRNALLSVAPMPLFPDGSSRAPRCAVTPHVTRLLTRQNNGIFLLSPSTGA